jgi:hypothetical protein
MAFTAFVATGIATPGDWPPVFDLLERAGMGEATPPAVVIAAPTAPKRPPQPEVLDLWGRCRPVVDDAGCSAWLTSRGIDPRSVADRAPGARAAREPGGAAVGPPYPVGRRRPWIG